MLKVPDRPITSGSVFSKNLLMQGVERHHRTPSMRKTSRKTSTTSPDMGWDNTSAVKEEALKRPHVARRRMELNEDAVSAAASSSANRLRSRGSLSIRGSIKQLSKSSRHFSIKNAFMDKASRDDMANLSLSQHDFSSHSLLGQYTDMKKGSAHGKQDDDMGLTRMGGKARVDQGSHTVQGVLADLMKEKAGTAKLRRLFDEIDTDGSGTIDEDEFVLAMKKSDPTMSEQDARKIFHEADTDRNGQFTFDEFLTLAKTPEADLMSTLQQKDRNRAGLSTIMPSEESYFGEEFRKNAPSSVETFNLAKSQHFVMELYESRIASLQRFVAMTVMFHQLGKRVQDFFPKMSFGLLGYRMDRTHSIMRIATTASPVSGADVRERMEVLRITRTIMSAVATISRAFANHLDDKMYAALNQTRDDAGGSSSRRLGSSRRLQNSNRSLSTRSTRPQDKDSL